MAANHGHGWRLPSVYPVLPLSPQNASTLLAYKALCRGLCRYRSAGRRWVLLTALYFGHKLVPVSLECLVRLLERLAHLLKKGSGLGQGKESLATMANKSL